MTDAPDVTPARATPFRWPVIATLCFAIGVGAIAVVAVVDHRTAQGPWQDALALLGTPPDWSGVTAFVEAPLVEDGGELRTPGEDESDPRSELDFKTVFVVLILEFTDDDWKSILAEGSPPRPGANEALAGSLCRANEIYIDGELYRVTGRLRKNVPGLSTVYAARTEAPRVSELLENRHFLEGFLDREGYRRSDDPNFEWPDEFATLFIQDAVPVSVGLSVATLAALTLVLFGAATLQWSAVKWMSRNIGAFRGVVTAAEEHPMLFRNIRLMGYAVFLAPMAAGTFMPHLNMAVSQLLFEVFSEGSLKDLGQAYRSGNIPRAAWETFHNNFIVQTFIMSSLPSLLIPFFGVAKIWLTLSIVGFALAPIWSGSAAPLVFHCVTVAIELEAYIIVSFGICVYAVRAWRTAIFLFTPAGTEEKYFPLDFRFGFEALASATMYACLALAIAAVYEAVTLIRFGAFIAG